MELGSVEPPPTRRSAAPRGDLPLKGGGSAEGRRRFLTSPLEGEVGPAQPVRVGGGPAANTGSRLARFVVPLLALCALAPPASAGLYYSGEQYAELPSRLRGFLIDHRSLRTAGIERPGNLPP